MKRIAFIADLFRNELLGGGESNDANLIRHLMKQFEVLTYKCNKVTVQDLEKVDALIIGNFVWLPDNVKEYVINNAPYVIYEHDHKYVTTRDPSKFANFKAPTSYLVNEKFYNNAKTVVVLSKICEEVMKLNLPNAQVHSIGCSLWSPETLTLLRKLNKEPKIHDYGIMKSANPTKNYTATMNYCNSQNITPLEMHSSNYYHFLEQMATCKNFIFLPTVLETYSRICAEAKMLNLGVATNKKRIGFFSEPYSEQSGDELIDTIEQKNIEALEYFVNLIERI
ncbi:hypothetical protein CMI47_22825 [Candidatus Pacearchaeota archaeon]|nr:hypothetical protein [Candidatus Pacearchaeota archaeon]